MAFQNKNLSVIAYANGFTLWHYAARESLAETVADGFFDQIKSLMNAGDIIIVNADDDTALCKVASTEKRVSVSVMYA